MSEHFKLKVWAVVLCLASLLLTYPLVLFMAIALGNAVKRTLVLFIGGPCGNGQMRELCRARKKH